MSYLPKISCALVTGAVYISAAAMGAPPNILLMVADDLGYADLSCYGNDRVATPNIDRLADEGIRLTRFYAASGVCTPTRASFLTGQDPARFNIKNVFKDEGEYLPAGNTLPQILKSAGYTTALLGKWHLGGLRLKDRDQRDVVSGPHQHGYDHYLCQIEEQPLRGGYFRRGDLYSRGGTCLIENEQTLPESHSYYPLFFTDIMGEETLRLLNRYKVEPQPFFIHVNFQVPHKPLERAPEPHWRATAREGLSENQHRIRSMIACMDSQVGRIQDALQQNGQAENTIVIFTSDNGGLDDLSNNGGYRGGKFSLFEGGIRVPFIARWPEHIPAGTVSEAPLHSNDILPTLCEVGDISPPVDIDGTSMLSVLKGSSTQPGRPLFFQLGFSRESSLTEAVIQGPWKLMAEHGTPRMLFNLNNDPFEETNVMDKYPDKAEALRQHLFRWLNRPRTSVPVAL